MSMEVVRPQAPKFEHKASFLRVGQMGITCMGTVVYRLKEDRFLIFYNSGSVGSTSENYATDLDNVELLPKGTKVVFTSAV